MPTQDRRITGYNRRTVSTDPNTEEARLAHRVARGDQQAFFELYERLSAKVFGLAKHILGEPMAAEEVAQEVFLKLWQRADQYDPNRGKLATWLLTITRHAALDRIRRLSRRPQRAESVRLNEEWRPSLSDPDFDTDEARWRSLHFALQDLPPEQMQVIALAYFQGMSHSEIAKYLELPLGTVKTRIRLGMAKLRDAWFGSAEEDVRDASKTAGLDVS